jgi:hypothetical protein
MEYLIFLMGFRNRTSNPIPHKIKRRVIRDYSSKYNIRTFVETGTYLGDMIAALQRDFDEIHSVELFRPLFDKACLRFAVEKRVHIHFGDSADVLTNILRELKLPALFWLDAHYSGKGTARGRDDSPIIFELKQIFDCGQINHIVLIDDASEFVGMNGYPDVIDLKKLIASIRPDYSVSVAHNII